MTTVVHPGDSLSSRQCLAYVIVVGALTPPDPFTVDLHLPALTIVKADFSTAAAIQLTLTATTVGLALGQLLVGT
jgi:MFS transporter, DHA1 family, multidrug resistance protein